MNKNPQFRSFLSAACLALLAACAHRPAPPAFNTAALDQLLGDAVNSGEVVGVSALVFDQGQTVYRGAFGMADRELGAPMRLDSIVRIYSMTKTITSAIIMDLIEDGKLNLDDPVTDYIPELGQMQVMGASEDGAAIFTPQLQPMTIKDLLLHRSGIGYGIFGPINPVEEIYENADLFVPTEDAAAKMTKLSKLPLVAQPGTGWYYSLSIDVLGRIAEIIESKRLGAIMQERLFDPCGMVDTSFWVRPDQKLRFASAYYLRDDGSFVVAEDGQTSPYLTDNAFQSGGGGLVSTLADFAIFSQMMLDGGTCAEHRFLNTQTVDAMMTNQMDPDDLYLFPWLGGDTNRGFGFGGAVVIVDSAEQIARNGQSIGHFGWSGAARTIYWIDRPNGAFAILFLQYFGGEDPDLFRRYRVLVQGQTRQ